MELKINLNLKQLESIITQLPYEKKVSLLNNVLNSEDMVERENNNYQNLLDELIQNNGKYDNSMAQISMSVMD